MFVVASALITNFVAIAWRRVEMLAPCQAPANCAMGQLAASEHAALQAIGISSGAYFWVLEAIATVVLAFCTIAAITIYWPRRNSVISMVTSLFLVLVAAGSTLNIPALQSAHPELWLWFAVLDGLTATLIVLEFFLFPNGHFAPSWTRKAGYFWIALQLLALPLRKTADGNKVMSLLLLLGLGAVVVAQLQRYRKVSTPVEQQQTKWLLLACAAQGLSYAVAILVTVLWFGDAPPGLSRVLTQTALKLLLDGTLILVVVALGFAVRRYRLWDIDIVINRSLVYGGVTLLLAVLFAASVLVLRALAVRLTADNQLPTVLALSTLVVGALFSPTRRRLILLVDSRFYGIGVDVDVAEQGVRARRDQSAQDPQQALVASIPIRPLEGLHDVALGRTVDAAGDSGIVNLDTIPGDPQVRSTSSTLPRFDKLEFIGRGGMSRVYKAEHPGLCRPVAIKMMLPQLAAHSARSVTRFEREGQIMAGMAHANIVRLFDRGLSEDGVHYQILEYIGGPDLGSYLAERGRLELPEALPLLEEIASALDYIHARHVVHRDIKPGNILLDPVSRTAGDLGYRAVLTDFGIARAHAMDRFTTTELIGTLVYIAPEQIQDAASVDGRADVYSFGVLAYELLTGKPPFRGDHAMNLIMAHLKQPPDDPRTHAQDLPAAAADVILKSLAKRPGDRHATAGEVVVALQRSCNVRPGIRASSVHPWLKLAGATSC